jgi:galactose mutarotase-like enzyme
VGRVAVDASGLPLTTDANGLPIHGLLVGAGGWQVSRVGTRSGTARLQAWIDVDSPAFPFPHRLEVAAAAGESKLTIATTLTPTGKRSVPAAFGWHPYLRLPGASRRHWRLRLPDRTHLTLDRFGIPTGEVSSEGPEAEPIGGRTFDDLYALGRGRRLAVETDATTAIELHCGVGYPFAQVWVPPGRPFVALEPMTTATNALVEGRAPLVRPGDRFTARFELRLRAP